MVPRFLFFFLINLFIHLFNFWLHWVFAAARGFSLVAENGGYSFFFFFKVFIEFVTILLLFYVLVFWLRGMWDLSSPTLGRTRTPCIGRQSLNHWTTREVPGGYSFVVVRRLLIVVASLVAEHRL